MRISILLPIPSYVGANIEVRLQVIKPYRRKFLDESVGQLILIDNIPCY